MGNTLTIEEIKEKIEENLSRAKSVAKFSAPPVLMTKESAKVRLINYIIDKGLKYKMIISKNPFLYRLSKKIYHKIRFFKRNQ